MSLCEACNTAVGGSLDQRSSCDACNMVLGGSADQSKAGGDLAVTQCFVTNHLHYRDLSIFESR